MKKYNPFSFLVLFVLLLLWGSGAGAMLGIDTTIQRLEQAPDIQALPAVNRETAIADLTKPVLEIKPVRDLSARLDELASSDKLLLEQLAKIKESGSNTKETSAVVQQYLDLPILYLDLNLQAQTSHVLKAQQQLEGTLSDNGFITALSSLSSQHTQLIRLARFRDSLTLAPAIRLTEALRSEKSADIKVTLIFLKKRQQVVDAIGTALTELDRISEIHGIQTGLLTRTLAKPAFEAEQAALLGQLKAFKSLVTNNPGADRSLAGIEKLLVERFYDVQKLTTSLETTVAQSMHSTLLYPVPAQSANKSKVVADWNALRDELEQWSEESANQFNDLLPDLRARNRHIETLYQGASPDLQTRFRLLGTLLRTEQQVFDLFQQQWKQLESGKPSTPDDMTTFTPTLVDTGVLLEEFTITEKVLIGVTDQFVSALVDVENLSFDNTAGIQKQLRGLAKRLQRIDSDHATWLALQDGAEAYWKRMDQFTRNLLDDRKRMWSKALKTIETVKTAAPKNQDQATSLVLNGIDAKLTATSQDATLVKRMFEAANADPIARYLHGRPNNRGWAYYGQRGDLIQASVFELASEQQISQQINTVLNQESAVPDRAAALIGLVEPLDLDWHIAFSQQQLYITLESLHHKVVIGPVASSALRISSSFTQDRYLSSGDFLLSLLIRTAHAASPQPHQGKSFTHFAGRQLKKNQWSYYLTAGGGTIATCVAAVVCPPAAPVIAKGTAVALSLQASQDTIFASAHTYADTYENPADRKAKHDALESGETGVNVALAVYSLGKAGKGLVDAGTAAGKEVSKAQKALSAAQQAYEDAAESRQGIEAGYRAVRDYVRNTKGVAAGIEATREVIDAERGTRQILTGLASNIDKARRTLETVQAAQAATVPSLTTASRFPAIAEPLGDAASSAIGTASAGSGPAMDAMNANQGNQPATPPAPPTPAVPPAQPPATPPTGPATAGTTPPATPPTGGGNTPPNTGSTPGGATTTSTGPTTPPAGETPPGGETPPSGDTTANNGGNSGSGEPATPPSSGETAQTTPPPGNTGDGENNTGGDASSTGPTPPTTASTTGGTTPPSGNRSSGSGNTTTSPGGFDIGSDPGMGHRPPNPATIAQLGNIHNQLSGSRTPSTTGSAGATPPTTPVMPIPDNYSTPSSGTTTSGSGTSSTSPTAPTTAPPWGGGRRPPPPDDQDWDQFISSNTPRPGTPGGGHSGHTHGGSGTSSSGSSSSTTSTATSTGGGGTGYVVTCNKGDGQVVVSQTFSSANHIGKLSAGQSSKADAIAWVNANCPGWRCSKSTGACDANATASSSGTGVGTYSQGDITSWSNTAWERAACSLGSPQKCWSSGGRTMADGDGDGRTDIMLNGSLHWRNVGGSPSATLSR
jgi:hypothetical protein